MSEKVFDLKIVDLNKYYSGVSGSKIQVLEKINVSIDNLFEDGKIISILGPQYSGKSTLLKILGGLEKPSSGNVFFTGKSLEKPEGNVIYIPEKPSSFPWLSVQENLEFAESLSGKSKKDDEYSIKNLIDLLGLTGYEDHRPHEKSSGFRFRIALGRALVLEPKLILLDETFKYLDSTARNELYQLLENIQKKLQVSFILATANITEAIYLSDKILLMKKSPGEIFKEIILERETDYKKEEKKLFEFKSEIESAFAVNGGIPLLSIVN